MQRAHTASELALQLRKLDSYIQWEALKRPAMDADSPFASAEILQRRPACAPHVGWDYLVQMAPVETSAIGLGFGPNSGIRQPLQPLTAVPGAQQQQLQQQLMSKQAVPQLPGQLPAPLQQLQEAEQRQQQSAQMPNQALSVLPNDVAVKQQQQAYGAKEDQQIGVQQAVSALSDAELPQQLPVIAESVRRPAQSALPDQRQADSSLPNGLPAADTDGIVDAVRAVSTDASPVVRASRSPELDTAPAQLQAAVGRLPGTGFASEASTGDHGDQTRASGAKLSQQTEAQVKLEITGAPQQPSTSPSHAPHPTPAPTPFLTQQQPKQASSLLSLIPNNQHRPSLAASSAQALAQSSGPSGRPLGQNSGAGPSREGTPAPRGLATWLHESQLPLWLVRTSEEKRRRDVAMVAARAAQQAQRDTNAASRAHVHLSHPYRNESTPCLTVGLLLLSSFCISMLQWTACACAFAAAMLLHGKLAAAI